MSLPTLQTVKKLQRALHAKAKRAPDFRFYTLYDKIYRRDVLREAFERCRVNGGAPGVDGETFAQIETYGQERWLGALAEALRTKTYRPRPLRRKWIRKSNGKKRPLGIPTIRDRVAQTAAVIILEPILEADLQPEQYAYRPGRSAHDAIRRVHKLLQTGHTDVVDADLKGYFDSIPHGELLRSVCRRVSDGSMLHLIKMWLEMSVEERDARGRVTRRTRSKDQRRGTPQGAPISPLLSNLYMRRFVLGWKQLGYERRLDAHIAGYADDFVICCRRSGREAMTVMRSMMTQLKLTVNEAKTTRCQVPEESFDFLGYTIGRCYSARTGRRYLGTRPAKASLQRMCRSISTMTARRYTQQSAEQLVRSINRMLVGWSNYFCLGPVSKAYRAVDQHTRRRLRHWLCAKHKVGGAGTGSYPDEHLHGDLGLVRLTHRRRSLS